MRFLTIKILIIFGILNSFISEINAQKFDLEGYYMDSINLASYYYLKIDSNGTFVYQSSGFSHHFVFKGSWFILKKKLFINDDKGKYNLVLHIKDKKGKVLRLCHSRKWCLEKVDRVLPLEKESIDYEALDGREIIKCDSIWW